MTPDQVALPPMEVGFVPVMLPTDMLNSYGASPWWSSRAVAGKGMKRLCSSQPPYINGDLSKKVIDAADFTLSYKGNSAIGFPCRLPFAI